LVVSGSHFGGGFSCGKPGCKCEGGKALPHFSGGFSTDGDSSRALEAVDPTPVGVCLWRFLAFSRSGLTSQTPPHFGGGFSRVTAHSFSSPPWWGSVDQRLTHAPHPRGSLSAIARASQLAPPLWGWVKRIPSAPQRGGFSCYRSCPPSWESVPTKISPFRWEFVALAQLASPTSVGVSRLRLLRERVLLRPSPTSVGVSRLRLTIPANVGVFPDSPSFSPSWGWIQYWPNKPHHRGSPAVLLK
jgi:hypothetical protein